MSIRPIGSNIKRAFSYPLQKWVRENSDGENRLARAGISVESLRNIRMGRCTEKFLFQFKKELEAVTSLSVETIFVRAVKRELWGKKDKFPGITTRTELVLELRQAASGRSREIKRFLHFDGSPSHFKKVVADPSKLWVARTTGALRALEYLREGKQKQGVSASAQAGKGFQLVDEPAKSNSSERTVDSIISMLNSLANIADANVDRDLVSGAQKTNVAYAAAKVLERLGVTPATLKAFKEKRGGADTTNLQHVLKILGRE